MAYYIKANPLVVSHLGLTTERYQLSDGNYLLWQADMLSFGSLVNLRENAAAVGALLLTPEEARQEQDGRIVRTLPTATDERFIIKDTAETPETDGTETETPEVSEKTETTDKETETDAKPTETDTEATETEAPEVTESTESTEPKEEKEEDNA